MVPPCGMLVLCDHDKNHPLTPNASAIGLSSTVTEPVDGYTHHLH